MATLAAPFLGFLVALGLAAACYLAFRRRRTLLVGSLARVNLQARPLALVGTGEIPSPAAEKDAT